VYEAISTTQAMRRLSPEPLPADLLPKLFDAAAGDDQINLGRGSDTAQAGAGDHRINGGSGTDTVDGGDGSDRCTGVEDATNCE